MKTKSSWHVKASSFAKNTYNPIRSIMENMDLNPNPDKHMIALSIGDPTVFGNLEPPIEIVESTMTAVRSMKYNGYAPSTGFTQAREAVARYCSVPAADLDPQDVILCSGCSHALDLCISALANPGQNILIPRPGFSLYRTLAEGFGIHCKSYNLLPEKNWEADLEQMESLIDSNTCAIIVNNPSNPCGSVFSKRHLLDILQIAARNHVVIIADEIYDYFTFPGNAFYPIASLTTEVPILACGGLTKRFLVPGWRMGWVLIHDRNGVFETEVRKGLLNLSQRIIGSNTLIQGALPDILEKTPESFFRSTIDTVQSNAEYAYSALIQIPGMQPVMPQGAMYMMVGLDMDHFSSFKDDLEFVESLVAEQSVFCLPGKCFDYPNFVRLVLTVPEDQLREACYRIAEFCSRHYQAVKKSQTRKKLRENAKNHIHNKTEHETNGREPMDSS